MSETKAYYRIDGGMEYVTYVDTYDIAKVTADIRTRHAVDDDVEITVRIPSNVTTPDAFKEATSVREVTLTDDEMAAVQQAITDNGEVAGLLVIWESILGAPLADQEENLNPSGYAIPFTQWEEIAGYMIRDSRVQHPSYEGIPAFSMVNQGPSSFVPVGEEAGA